MRDGGAVATGGRRSEVDNATPRPYTEPTPTPSYRALLPFQSPEVRQYA